MAQNPFPNQNITFLMTAPRRLFPQREAVVTVNSEATWAQVFGLLQITVNDDMIVRTSTYGNGQGWQAEIADPVWKFFMRFQRRPHHIASLAFKPENDGLLLEEHDALGQHRLEDVEEDIPDQVRIQGQEGADSQDGAEGQAMQDNEQLPKQEGDAPPAAVGVQRNMSMEDEMMDVSSGESVASSGQNENQLDNSSQSSMPSEAAVALLTNGVEKKVIDGKQYFALSDDVLQQLQQIIEERKRTDTWKCLKPFERCLYEILGDSSAVETH